MPLGFEGSLESPHRDGLTGEILSCSAHCNMLSEAVENRAIAFFATLRAFFDGLPANKRPDQWLDGKPTSRRFNKPSFRISALGNQRLWRQNEPFSKKSDFWLFWKDFQLEKCSQAAVPCPQCGVRGFPTKVLGLQGLLKKNWKRIG